GRRPVIETANLPVSPANPDLNRAYLDLVRPTQMRRAMGQHAHLTLRGNHPHCSHFFAPHACDTSLFRCPQTHRIAPLYLLAASGKQKTLPVRGPGLSGPEGPKL